MSHSWLEEPGFDMLRLTYDMNDQLRDGPFDIRVGGGWDFFEKNNLFPYRREKIKCLQRS